MKHLLLETPEADLFLEQDAENNVYLHLTYKGGKWTKTVYNRLMETLSEILDALKEKGVKFLYALLFKDDPKMLKFTVGFGFTPDVANSNYLRLKLEV